MAPHWKLTVDGFGKIEHAEVDVRPLTLFVGPNNSGKSYLASLIWGIVAMQGELELAKGPELEACEAWIAKHFGDGSKPAEELLGPDEIAKFDNLFEKMTFENRGALVREIFHDEISLKRFTFRNLTSVRPSKWRWSGRDRAGESSFVISYDSPNRYQAWRDWLVPSTAQDSASLRHQALRSLLRILSYGPLALSGNGSRGMLHPSPVYLPASRTGLVQLYKATARLGMIDAHRRDANTPRWLDLTEPTFKFLDLLAFGLMDDGVRRTGGEAELLESALTGRVEMVPTMGVNEFRYHPSGGEHSLPMKLSSALVTELAPLIFVLRNLSHFQMLILEEPEAHLHPELQRLVAQVIVRLVRKGLIVVITTHSADFCQQINNFMKLGALSPDKRAEAQKKFGYESQDYLELDDVSGYEFKLDATGEHTDVIPMKKTPAGLVMPTFNKSLSNLTDEVFALQDLLAEQDDAS